MSLLKIVCVTIITIMFSSCGSSEIAAEAARKEQSAQRAEDYARRQRETATRLRVEKAAYEGQIRGKREK